MLCSRSNIVSATMSWIGAPWRHQGRSHLGVDCVGLVIGVAHETGLSDFDTSDYDRRPTGVNFLANFKEHMDLIATGTECGGDVIVMRDDRFPCHCGIIVPFRGTFYLVHAAAKRKKVVMEPFAGKLQGRRVASFRYRGLVD